MARVVIKYVWELPVRITHWVNALAIGVLCVTGLYIGFPATLALTPAGYVMGWTRFIHFVAGYTFAISVAARVWWAFVGNEYAGWRTFFPWREQAGREEMRRTFLFYVFIRNRPPQSVGHNAMANSFYVPLFALFLVEIVTGFALYSLRSPSPVIRLLFGWFLGICPSQYVRLVHHLTMYFILGFTIQHIYSSWLMDIKLKGGLISGIFSGYKYMKE